MALKLANIHSYGSVNDRVSTAAIGVAAPTSPLPVILPATWFDVGWLDDAGLSETTNFNSTKKYGFQGGGLLRELRNQFENPWTFTALERNETTDRLRNPLGTRVSVPGTAEIQTLSISGVPTGGTFTPSYKGVSGGPQTYNVTPAALATALSTAWGITVAVSGTAGASYVITFPTTEGNAQTITVAAALTGGTTPAATVSTTTPGTPTLTTIGTTPNSSVNLRQFVIDLSDGTVNNRLWFPTAEAAVSGATPYTHGDFTSYQFTVSPYQDGAGQFYYTITDDGAMIPGSFL